MFNVIYCYFAVHRSNLVEPCQRETSCRPHDAADQATLPPHHSVHPRGFTRHIEYKYSPKPLTTALFVTVIQRRPRPIVHVFIKAMKTCCSLHGLDIRKLSNQTFEKYKKHYIVMLVLVYLH